MVVLNRHQQFLGFFIRNNRKCRVGGLELLLGAALPWRSIEHGHPIQRIVIVRRCPGHRVNVPRKLFEKVFSLNQTLGLA